MCAKQICKWNKKLYQRTMYFVKKMFLKFINTVLSLTVTVFVSTTVILIISALLLCYSRTNYNEYRSYKVKGYAENPVLVWWTQGFPNIQCTIHCSNGVQCELVHDRTVSHLNVGAYLFYGSNINFTDLPLPRRPQEIIWGLYHEESPRNVAELMHKPVLNLFNFSSTFSRHSNIPFPLQFAHNLKDVTSTKYFVSTTEKNSFLKDLSPILFLQSDCDTGTEREVYVDQLMKLIDVDSYGACLNNKDLPEKFKVDYLNNLDNEEFLKFIARYKFVIAIENGVCEDYVTEKFWRAIKVGSVPIYFGSPSVRDWLPNKKSAILLEDYPTPEMIVKHIKRLLQNDNLYEQYLEHKIKGLISNQRLIKEFENTPNQSDAMEMVDRFNCLICEKIHDKEASNNIVNTTHYDCPKPISALTLSVNPENDWVFAWEMAKEKANRIYEKVIGY